MGGRLKSQKLNDGPGPGSYDVRGKPEGPLFSMGAGDKESLISKISRMNEVPAPNSYNVTPKKSKRGISIDKEKKGKIIKNEIPGPGNYKI